MRLERLIIVVLSCALGWALWKLHRGKVRRWWQRVKDQLPRQWRPKSPEDCALCQAEIEVQVISAPTDVAPYRTRKNTRGRKKRVATQGFACLDEACVYYGVTDEQEHALVGYGKLGEHKDIQRLKCQACVGGLQQSEGHADVLCEDRGGSGKRSVVVFG